METHIEETNTLDPERQKQAKKYARIQRRFSILGMLLGGLYAVLWLLFGWSVDLRNAMLNITHSPLLLVAGFAAIFGAIIFFIDLPMDFYTGYVLPHRYDLSTQDLKGWITDQLKGLAVGLPLGLLVLEAIYAVLRASPNLWWLWGALLMLFFNVVLAIIAPTVLMPIFNKFVPLEDEHADLKERLLKLAERAGARVEGVYKFDMSRRTRTANAALTGLGKTRRIILGDTLIENFTPEEIETVLAHEMGHHVNRDIPLLITANTALTLLGFYLAGLGMAWGVGRLGLGSVSDVAAMPLFGLVLGVYGFVTMPLGNALSRWRERLADRFALEVTQNGEAFAGAMTRLANQNLADVDPEPWVEFMFHSHPALSKRIAAARGETSHTAATGEAPPQARAGG